MGDRHSIRLQGYDYSQNGWYFMTISTKEWEYLFGGIDNQEIVFTKIGLIVKSEIERCSIDVFQVMPNHIHVIFVVCRGLIHQT